MNSKSNGPLSESSLPDVGRELRHRQLGLVRSILWAALVVGVPTAAVASVRAISIGEPGRATLYVVILLVLISILAWRRAPFGLQGFVLVGSLVTLAVYELTYEGLNGNGPVFLLSAVSMATLVMARRYAFLLLMLAVGIFAGFAWLFTAGGLEVAAERLPSSGEHGEWIATGLVFLMLTGMLYASQSYLIPALTKALNRAQMLAGELRGTVREKEDLVSLQRAVFEAAADGILAVDLKGRVVSHNGRFASMWSLEPDAFEAGDEQYLIDAFETQLKDPSRLGARITAIYGRPDASSFDMLELADGRVFERISLPHRLGDEIVGRVWSFRDVTERLNAQRDLEELNRELEARVAARTAELEAANIELDAFASTVSHDLRAPLHSMNWFSACLVEDHADELSSDARQKTDRIQAAAERMEQLIDALLALSRVTRSSLDIGEIDVSRLAEAVVNDLRHADSERRADVEIEPGLIDRGDQALVKSVLENLIGNAWKFSSKCDHARIRFARDHDESARCGVPVYIVEDNGAGFEMEYAKDLFKPFNRLHRVDEFAGTGVGLATVQRIIRRHGGKVWALGRVGEGAEIRFTLGPGRGDGGGDPEPDRLL